MSTSRKLIRSVIDRIASQPVAGQGLVEYSMLLIIMFIACLSVVTLLGDTIDRELWSAIRTLPF